MARSVLHGLHARCPGEGQALLEGRVIAFNEVISIVPQEAPGFGIPLRDLQLADIEPDRDLVHGLEVKGGEGRVRERRLPRPPGVLR
jgi:hypothetical protein